MTSCGTPRQEKDRFRNCIAYNHRDSCNYFVDPNHLLYGLPDCTRPPVVVIFALCINVQGYVSDKADRRVIRQ